MKLLNRIFAVAATLFYVGFAYTQPGPLPKEELQALAATYQMLRNSFVKPLTGEEILQAALRGMLKEVDPDGGQFFMQEEFRDFMGSANYTGGAVGLEMIGRKGEVVVMSPIVDSPAERAGIRPNDVVYAIDGTVIKANLVQAFKMLRGPLGSTTVVTIRRPGESTLRDVKVERRDVQGAVVRVSAPSPEIVVLRITSFNDDTLRQIAGGLAAQWGKKRFKGLVLDLRRNPGGLLDVAIGVSSLFLPPKSLIAQTDGRSPESKVNYFADPKYYARGTDPFATIPPEIRTLPLVVLVDEGTASGAEIVAAALRDHRRARIVGHKTFGRTSIATVMPLGGDRAVRFTTAYWFPPSHEMLDKVGITPDRIVEAFDFQREFDEAILELRLQLQ